jgi:hypothetical protein
MIKFLALLSIVIFSKTEDYRDIFGEHYQQALSLLNQKGQLIDSLANIYQVEAKLTSAVIFPEIIRYSIIRDILERNTLEIVYVNTGKADFSIGPLQIKPSFAETIEKMVNEKEFMSSFRDKFSYSSDLPVEIRKERLNRLKDFNFQLHYVLAFQKLTEERFPFLQKSDTEYKVRFVSTAYNYSFLASKRKIDYFMEQAFFPWGVNNNRKKYKYADISWFYYSKQANKSPDL